MDNNCDKIQAEHIFPVTQLPLICATPAASPHVRYISRGSIKEEVIVVTGKYSPVSSPTPTPSNTPSLTPTPAVTVTPTPTPVSTLTCTPTVTPTATPQPTPSSTHTPLLLFRLTITASVYTHLVIYFDYVNKVLIAYHAVESNFPLNPIGVHWELSQDNIIIEQGETKWHIPWQLTRYSVDRLQLKKAADVAMWTGGSLATAGAALAVAETGISTTTLIVAASMGPLALAAAVIIGVAYLLYLLLFPPKPPPPRPRPQYSPPFKLPITHDLPVYTVNLLGTLPPAVYEGNMFIDTYPVQENQYIIAVDLIDSSDEAKKTLDPWNFTIESTNR